MPKHGSDSASIVYSSRRIALGFVNDRMRDLFRLKSGSIRLSYWIQSFMASAERWVVPSGHLSKVVEESTGRQCPECGCQHLSRLPRKGYLERTIYPLFGYFPWECVRCGVPFMLKKRYKRKQARVRPADPQYHLDFPDPNLKPPKKTR